MRRVWPMITILGLLIGPGADAVGQTLRLGRPAPPELDQFTHAAQLAAELEAEIADRLAAASMAGESEATIFRAQAKLRQIAIDLLAMGDRAGEEGSSSVLAGLTLANGRAEIDAILRTLAERIEAADSDTAATPNPEVVRARAAMEAINLFDRRDARIRERLADGDPQRRDATLADVLGPLADAVAALEGEAIVNHWVARVGAFASASDAGAHSSPDESLPSLTDLRDTIETASLRDDVRDEFRRLHDFLARGREFSEFSDEVASYHRLLARTVNFAAAVADASWLNEQRTDYDDRLLAALHAFATKETREQARGDLQRMIAVAPVLGRISRLGTIRRKRVDASPLITALETIRVMLADDAAHREAREQLVRLALVLDGMIAYRQSDRLRLPGKLRFVGTKLERGYEEAERRLLKKIPEAFGRTDALGDPSFLSALENQRQFLEDMARLRLLPTWVAGIESIDLEAGKRFEAQTRKMAAWLIDPIRRSEAILAMGQFEEQSRLFSALPLEGTLRTSDVTVASMVGGQPEQLAGAIDRARRAWANAWAAGDAGSDAANEMLLFRRLLDAIADLLAVQGDGGPLVLNRWSAWELSPTLLRGASGEAVNRVRLAVRAAIAGDTAQLLRRLEAIDQEAAVLRLAGRLIRLGESDLDRLGAGAIGSLGQLVEPPDIAAWLLNRRGEIASICRYDAERAHAARSERSEFARQCEVYVRDTSLDLLEYLGERRAPFPALLGFDGSDPNPNLENQG